MSQMMEKTYFQFPNWLGDVVMTLPGLYHYRLSHPDRRMIGCIKPAYAPVLKRWPIDMELWEYDKSQRKELLRNLKSKGAGEVVLFTNSLGSFWPFLMSGCRPRLGLGERWTRLLLDIVPDNAVSSAQGEKITHLLGGGDVPEPLALPSLIKPLKLAGQPPHLLIFPGAQYGLAKQWRVESYAGVADRAVCEGWQVTLCGTSADRELAQAIVDISKAKGKIMTRTRDSDLEDLFLWLEGQPNLLGLCNDSGALHLLAACGIPALGLYLSTSADKTPPAFGRFKLVEAVIECRPCFRRECPYGHYACRDRVSSESVFETLLSFSAGE